MVEDGAFSHKIDYIQIFKEILNHQNRITGSKETAFFAEWVDFAYWWSFSGEGSASAASAAGLINFQHIPDCPFSHVYLHQGDKEIHNWFRINAMHYCLSSNVFVKVLDTMAVLNVLVTTVT